MKKVLMVAGCVVVLVWIALGADLYTVNVGTTANDGTGDPFRTAFQKVNSNFAAMVRSLAGAATNLSLHGPMVKSGGLTLDGGGIYFNEGNPPIIKEAMGKAISFPGGVEARGLFSTNGFFNDAQGTNAYTWWAPRIAAQDGNLLLGNSAADLVTVVGTLVGGAYSFGPSMATFKSASVTNDFEARKMVLSDYDRTNSPESLITLAHGGQGAAESYGINLYNYRGARSAMVIHNYSSNGLGLQIDSVANQSMIKLKNATNDVLAPGQVGTSPFFEFAGYDGYLGSGNEALLGMLTESLYWVSYTSGKPWTFTASGAGAPALFCNGQNDGEGLRVYSFGSGEGVRIRQWNTAPALNVQTPTGGYGLLVNSNGHVAINTNTDAGYGLHVGNGLSAGIDGSVTVGGNVRHLLGTNQVTGSLTNRMVDFNAPRTVLLATNDLNFTHATNLVAGRWVDAVVKMYAGPTNRQVWLPSAWVQIGSGGTNYWLLASNKVAILSIAADGDQQTNVCAVYAVQP